MTSYLHIAVVFSCFQSFARSCNSPFFYVDFSDWEKNKVEFYEVYSVLKLYKLVSVGKKFYSVKLPKLSVSFCPTVFLIIFYFICFNTFYAKTGKFDYCGGKKLRTERQKGEGLRIPRGQP